ncbi:MAG: hypothetical protein FJY81_07035, partial [Candidatus Aminicenantes bacterium]|nr:hypothetical protein [Candidatus Aminicenantes bacterium]
MVSIFSCLWRERLLLFSGRDTPPERGEAEGHPRRIRQRALRHDLPAGHRLHVPPPVGYRYSYSNLGIDLAGFILEKKRGKPFEECIREYVFGPLGM